MSPAEPWYEEDDFWKLMRPYLFADLKWERAEDEAMAIIEYVDLQPGSSVLDLPCGTGRHALAFARRDMEVTAVDRTSLYVDEVRVRADEAGLDLQTHVSDMRQFKSPSSFDLALNLFTSFGYFDDEDQNQRVLQVYFDSLKSGGMLVMEMAGKELVARDFRPRDWRDFDDGTLLLEEREIGPDWSSITNRWTLVLADGARHQYTFSHRLYAGSELRKMLDHVGFIDIDIFGDFDGAPYDDDASRLIAFARKP